MATKHIASLITLIFALIMVSSPSISAEEARPVHLILLSGQSNMAGMNPEKVFTPEINKHFGAENVVVVKVAQGGQPIRRWLWRRSRSF
jgi:hypothetical protein